MSPKQISTHPCTYTKRQFLSNMVAERRCESNASGRTRLSHSEIDRAVQEAEKYRNEDEADTKKTETKSADECRDEDKAVPQNEVEVPQIRFIDRVVDIPVVQQRQVPMVQTIHKTVEIPQAQFLDKVVDMPVVVQRQVHKVQKTQEVPHLQLIDEVVDVPRQVVRRQGLRLWQGSLRRSRLHPRQRCSRCRGPHDRH